MTDTPDRRDTTPTRRTDPAVDDRNEPLRRDSADPASRPVAHDRTEDVPPAGAVAPRDVAARERERFGGMKFGSALFGWLAAVGFVAVLSAFIAAIGGALGYVSVQAVDDASEAAADNPLALTIIGAVAIGLVLFVGYFIGGYVAGRMARFSGLMQGLGVWLWAIIFAVVVAILAAVGGAQWNLLSAIDGFPRIPVTADAATVTGILTALSAAIITLAGALLGGLAGMRYHRKVDRVGLGLAE